MKPETISDHQIDHLRAAARDFYDQRFLAGQAGAVEGAAFDAAEEIGVVTGGVVGGVAKHLLRLNRRALYGPNDPIDNLDPQG